MALLLLLQRRGKVTAAEVAEELEVSERTARRDLEALGMAGLPVYAVVGRNGGWRLAGGGRTDLSGLSEPEVRALFAVAGPDAAASQEVRAALRKLVRALPEPLRARAEAASRAVVVDPVGWGQSGAAASEPPLLGVVQAAVIDGVQLRLGYGDRQGAVTSRVVHPLGLAAKGARWYLVADTADGQRTFRVDRMRSAEPTGAPVVRPEGFELSTAWQAVTDTVEERRAPYRAVGRADPAVVPVLRFLLGTRLTLGGVLADGWVELEVREVHARAIAGRVAGLGDRVELFDEDVRRELAELGRQLVRRYG